MAEKPKSKSKRTKATAGDNTPSKQRGLKPPWEPGQSGNPAGRPKGARVKFGEDFVVEFAAHWKEHGLDALNGLYAKSKEAYCKVAVALLPKLIDVRGEIDHKHVHEAIPWDAIIERCEQYRDTERKPRLDS